MLDLIIALNVFTVDAFLYIVSFMWDQVGKKKESVLGYFCVCRFINKINALIFI